jgi:hypothetical protein
VPDLGIEVLKAGILYDTGDEIGQGVHAVEEAKIV